MTTTYLKVIMEVYGKTITGLCLHMGVGFKGYTTAVPRFLHGYWANRICNMALEPKVKTATHSKTLFTDASANPIVFYMRPCSERQFLKPLIEVGIPKVST